MKDKLQRDYELKQRNGWIGYLTLKEIYPFQIMMQDMGWQLLITQGCELARLRKDGSEVVFWWSEKHHKVVTSRYGMVLSYIFHYREGTN